MEWSKQHDVLLCREILAVDPFQAKRKTTARAKYWEKVAANLEKIDKPKFKVSTRAVRDRYSRLHEKFKNKAREEKGASGISPEPTELDTLLEELSKRQLSSDEERFQSYQENEKKNELDRIKSLDIRKKAMEKLSETKLRKEKESDSGDQEPQRKRRRSGGEIVAYLKEKNEVELEMRKQELEMKKMQFEADKKRQDDILNLLMQQNTMIINLIKEKNNTK